MKKTTFILLLLGLISFSYAQEGVSPSNNNEYCPTVEYTFNVTIPGTYSSIIGNAGCTVTQAPYNFSSSGGNNTFSFKGKFGDVNQAQTFAVNYSTTTGSVTYNIIFKKIKSLFYQNNCSPIQPNLSTIIAAPCQIVNIPVNFNNVSWFTNFESPTLCFGTISNYEYQLPSGWSIGSNVSNGTNWISGSNSVTITTDISNGNGMTVKIRPANNCGSGLLNVQQPTQIGISRPKPPLTFSAVNPICSVETYTANGLPSVFTNLSWNVTPSGLVSFSNANAASTSVSALTNGVGDLSFDISSTGCPLSFSYNTQEVTGRPQLITGQPSAITGLDLLIDITNDCYVPIDKYTVIGGEGATNYKWYRRVLPNGSFILKQDGPLNYYYLSGGIPGDCIDIEIKVVASNNCNSSSPLSFTMESLQCRCSKDEGINGRFAASPNPTTGEIQIESKDKRYTIKEIQVADKLGSLKKKIKLSGDIKAHKINIAELPADIYIIRIYDGKTWVSQKVIKS